MRFSRFFLLLLALAAAGCGPQTAAPTNGSELHLSAADNGRTVPMKVHDRLVIELEANPSTGFSWEPVQVDAAVLKQVGETEFQSASSTPLAGQGGTQILRFEVTGPGSTSLELVYHRPWESGVPPLQTFTLQITVQ